MSIVRNDAAAAGATESGTRPSALSAATPAPAAATTAADREDAAEHLRPGSARDRREDAAELRRPRASSAGSLAALAAALPAPPDSSAHHQAQLEAESHRRHAEGAQYSLPLDLLLAILPSFVAAARENQDFCTKRLLTPAWLLALEGEIAEATGRRNVQPRRGRPRASDPANGPRLAEHVTLLEDRLEMIREAARAELSRYALPRAFDRHSAAAALPAFNKFLEGAKADIAAIAAGVAAPTAFQKAGLTADDVAAIEAARDDVTAMIQEEKAAASSAKEDTVRLQILHHALDHALERLKAVLRLCLKNNPEKKKALFSLIPRKKDRREAPATEAPAGAGGAAPATGAFASSGAHEPAAPAHHRRAGHGHGRAAADAVAPEGMVEGAHEAAIVPAAPGATPAIPAATPG
jgi:hypothetical protein